MAKPEIKIVITPAPVIVGQPWHVVVSELRPGQDKIVLGYTGVGFDEDFINQTYFTADANGKIETSPPPLTYYEAGQPDGWDQITFNVSEARGGGAPNTPPNLKVIATTEYQMAVV